MSGKLLDPIPGLEFFSDLHRYRYKGRWLPFSVSRIASPVSPEVELRFEATRHIGEPRGNAVHEYCEALLTGQERVKDEFSEWTDALDKCSLLRESEVVAAEYRMCDARKGVGGSFDFLLRKPNGQLVLGDLKTVGSASAVSKRQPAKAQLGGYAAMLIDHHKLHIDLCCTLVCGPGKTRILEQKTDECVSAWVDAWDFFKLDQGLF